MSNKTLLLLKQHLKFSWYLWKRLPLAWLMGLRIKQIEQDSCSIILPFKKRNLNPFKSMYFAAQIAAAELSTGLLLLVAIDGKPKISMLVKELNASFFKKAVTDIVFICNDGKTIEKAINQAIVTEAKIEFQAVSFGYNKEAEIVSETKITWSIKLKK